LALKFAARGNDAGTMNDKEYAQIESTVEYSLSDDTYIAAIEDGTDHQKEDNEKDGELHVVKTEVEEPGRKLSRRGRRKEVEEDAEKVVASKVEEQEEFMRRVNYIADNSKEEHDEFRLRCALCDKIISKLGVSTHVALYHCNISYPCSFCDKFRGNRKNIKKHIANEHEEVSKTRKGGFCALCNKNVTKIGEHTKRVHLQVNRCACIFCGKGFFDQKDLERHQRRVHSDIKEMCPECGLHFKNVAEHMKTVHVGRSRETCPECGKSVGDLKDHMKSVHEKVKNYSCTICTLQTYKLSTLKRHMMAHEKYSFLNKPYEYRKPEYNLENMGKATELVMSGKMSRRKASISFNLSVHELKKACEKASLSESKVPKM